MPRKSSRPAGTSSPWSTGAVSPQDLRVAEREALLQLKIGRSAHLAAIAISAALALDAVVLLFVFPTLPALRGSDTGLSALRDSYYLVLPIAVAVGAAAVGLFSKWESYDGWPWEPHFSISVGALVFNGLLAVFYGLRIAGDGPTAHLDVYPTFVPLVLVGMSASLLGIAATWRPWGARAWTSAIAAGLPVATALLVFVHPGSASGSSEGLALSFLVSAILYQTSGSFLHLISSGTGPHQDAVVLSGQNRIVRLADEVRQREEAIRFREAALVKREADAEGMEASLARARTTLDDRKAELDKIEGSQRDQDDALAQRERDLVGRAAALEMQARAVQEKAKGVDLRTDELTRQAPELAAREQRLADREGALTRRDIELAQRGQELDRRAATVTDGETRVATRRKEIDQKTADLLRREGEVAARERGGAAVPTLAGAAAAPAAGADLAAREARTQHLKTLLDEQNVQLGRRSKEVAEQAKVVESGLRQIVERQSALAARETSLSQREADLEERLKVADERRLQFETAARDYQQRLDEVGQQQVATAQKGADLDRQLRSAADRERGIADREGRLRTASAELDRREQEVILRERSVDADVAEVSLRRQGIGREGDLPFAGLLAVAAADRADQEIGPSWAGRSRRPRGVAEPGPAPAEEPATLAPPTARKYADRLPTGTPRLDDLLLGGLPPKSHVVLVGDAFVGKEVALYAFIAEGLKRGEPALLVTAAKSSAEVSDSLGVVLPQFREYEQLGSVRWIDASGTPAAGAGRSVVVKSSDDRPGILTALVAAAKQTEEAAKGGSFRVGFFGLSAVLAHADERASFSFLQNVVGILKPRNTLAMYALEAGALSEAQVESLLGRMDGAILFRQDRDRTFLSVKGFGDVATRDWVEVRATNRALVVGSFALERIR